LNPTTPQIGMAGSLRLLAGYLAPRRRAFQAIVAASLLDAALGAQISLSFKYLIDDAIGQRNGYALGLITIALGISVVVVTAAGVWRDRLYARTGAELAGDLRSRMFRHIQGLSASFHSRSQPADMVARFAADLTEIEEVFMSAVQYGILPGLDVLTSLALIFALDWRLALPAVLAFLLATIGPRWLAPRTSAAAYQVKRMHAQLSANVQENLEAHALVRAFGVEGRRRLYFTVRNRALEHAACTLGFLTQLMERSAGVTTQLLQVAVLGAGGYLAFRGQMSIGTFAAFQSLFTRLADSLGCLAEYLPDVVRATGGLMRIQELFAERPQVADALNASTLPPLQESIEFRNVTFGYSPDQRSLDGLSLRIPRGASAALVGPSGSGKSTILMLLMRFYDPLSGEVLIDGHDLRSVTQESLRRNMSIVFQDNFLFSSTIRENILLARPDAAAAEVEESARQAEIHEFIASLPDRYDTVTGASGVRLSGGQRQRLGIARALLRDPEILLLDEVTSALDCANEALINETIDRISRERTVVSVTHRLAAATRCDRIFYIEKGQVMEQGSHAELLARDGKYAGMWKKQSGFVPSADGESVFVTPERLRETPILSTLDDSILADLSRAFTTERYPRDQFVFYEGDVGDRFYILVRGTVEVLKTQPDGKLQRLAVLQDGDHFGDTALILNAPRNASVRTLADCTLLVLSRARFLTLMERVPTLRWQLREEAAIADFRTQPREDGSETAGTAGTDSGHILVVDDNAAGRDLLCGRLQREGYRVSAAAGGTEALELIHSAGIDLVLLEVIMPGLDGYAVLERLKEGHWLNNLPVIMMTAMDDMQGMARCIELGAEGFITKPFDPKLLRARLTASIAKKRARNATVAQLQEKIRTLEESLRQAGT
jgi:ATP-binding cassette, subfamily B, bacterial